ncbi:hypothetical protein LJC33_09175 [Eubacteriales bacterium OttesenSCG-928-N13]|nr:hypothetical protein [Eubacteriales bacterium OttesenSCG-928-N13]
MMRDIISALSSVRVPAVLSEYQLHDLVAKALADAGIDAQHEVKLAPRCRIDFLAGRIGIEIKQGEHQRGRLLQQAERYLAHDALDALVLVTTRGVNLPGEIQGKRLVVCGMNRLWGVALP